MCTNRVISMYHGETTQKFELRLCNEAYNERGERHDYSGVPFLNALGQEVEDMSTNINLLVSEEIVQEDCPWGGQCH